ncbi:Putative aminoacrylate peracid reductase RutC [Actinosynnema sp. ALI-1.44]
MSSVTHLNPPALHANPAFSQAVKVDGPGSLLFIGGQNGVDRHGQVVGDDAFAQSVQAFRNLEAVLEAAGGSLENVVKWTIITTDRAHIGPGFGAFQQVWAGRANPPAITVQIVSGLANPAYLVEIEAVAAL